MAKKTKAGGKVKKTVSKPAADKSETPKGGGWSADDKYNTKFNDHKKSDGKFKPIRIAKKMG